MRPHRHTPHPDAAWSTWAKRKPLPLCGQEASGLRRAQAQLSVCVGSHPPTPALDMTTGTRAHATRVAAPQTPLDFKPQTEYVCVKQALGFRVTHLAI